jgi:hypothetical protein
MELLASQSISAFQVDQRSRHAERKTGERHDRVSQDEVPLHADRDVLDLIRFRLAAAADLPSNCCIELAPRGIQLPGANLRGAASPAP